MAIHAPLTADAILAPYSWLHRFQVLYPLWALVPLLAGAAVCGDDSGLAARQPEHAQLALLAAQPHPAAPLQVQHGEGPDLANTEMDLERPCGAEKLAAVVSQGGGYGGLPATEVLGVQRGGQPSPMQRILMRGLGG